MPHSARVLPQKAFFKIGEVAELLGVKPHILRYWEESFRELEPMKTRGQHRVYRRKDVELAFMIHELVHMRGFTVAGARKYLRAQGRHPQAELPGVSRPDGQRPITMRLVRKELEQLRGDLKKALSELS